MQVFLVRHAIAHERNRIRWPNDALRPLTTAGIRKFRKAAFGIVRCLPKGTALLTSPYVRARETAAILADAVGRRKPIECSELASGESVGACFAPGVLPSITATGGTNQVDVSWSAVPGAASYRVYRARNGCGNNFDSIGTTATPAFTDPITVPGNYAYKVEAVDPDGFCVSAESNCSVATPTVYHATPTTAAYTDVCATGGPGSGNGVVEPGESVTMQVTLQNDSNTSLSSITGLLSSTTPGVTVTDPSAAWRTVSPAS